MVYRDQEIGMSAVRHLRSLPQRQRFARILDKEGFCYSVGTNLLKKQLRDITVEDKFAQSPRTDRALSRFTVARVDRD